MSKRETPMTRWFWQQVGGTLIEEFPAVKAAPNQGARLIDGLIISGGEMKIARASDISLAGQDVIVVQTKDSRLGMNLMGQAFFSASLIERFKPRSIQSVALCRENDAVLGPIFESYPNMKVVICPKEI